MSERIEFTPDGLVEYKWDGEKKKYIRKRPKKKQILTCLRKNCEIAEGTTLKQIFEAVDRYQLLKLVISQYSWCHDIDAFHAQAQEPQRFDPDDGHEVIDYLEIHHYPEVHQFTEKKKHPGGTRERTITVDFETEVAFHGLGPVDEKSEYPQSANKDGMVQYSVSYSPMWKIADLPVKLNKTFEVFEPFTNYKQGVPRVKLIDATRGFTLLEVLDAIYWDISFMGGPTENASFLESMKETVESMKNGEIPLIPAEKVIDDLPPTPEGGNRILMHPDVARFFGVDPDSIPLDDKEFIPETEEN